MAEPVKDDFEARLDRLREEGRAKGIVPGSGVVPRGSPMPPKPLPSAGGYFGLPLLKPPVWKWMIAVYFFVGGAAGMSALLGAAGAVRGDFRLARCALGMAAAGAVISTILLIWDLGRPLRFLHMLRVLKLQSPMSLGSWILSGFSLTSLAAWLLLVEDFHTPALVLALCAGLCGIFLATYTGALLAVTAIPAWHLHRGLLPFHFGMAGLGSAVAALRLGGWDTPPLRSLFLLAVAAEIVVFIRLETDRHGEADRALHQGRAGWTLRSGEVLTGPIPLLLALLHLGAAASVCFLLGALITRFGWLAAGKASALDPQAVLSAGQPGVTEITK